MSHQGPPNSQEQFNEELVKLQHSAKDVPFPKEYLKELQLLGNEASVSLLEGYIQSVLDRLKLPHVYQGKVTTTGFFDHLRKMSQQITIEYEKETNRKIEIEISLAGGVVRTMLSNVYKFVHERKKEQEEVQARAKNKENYRVPIPVSLRPTFPKDKDKRDIPVTVDYSKWEGKEPVENEENIVKKQKQLKQTMLQSTEFHLRQAKKSEKEALLSTFVLGVGSDMDVYYIVKPNDGTVLSDQEQGEANQFVKERLQKHLREIEHILNIESTKDPIKNSLLPEADVLNYQEQITSVLDQGGSLLDTLAFRLTDKDDKLPKIKMPEGHPEVLHDFIQGFFEVVEPRKGEAPDSTIVRGLRPLVEMPFLDIKDEKYILLKLLKILKEVQTKKRIEDAAIVQYSKMVRNANFQLGDNRPHKESISGKETPLSLGLKIAQALFDNKIGLNEKVLFLLPVFLPKMPLDSRSESDFEEAIKARKIKYNIEKKLLSQKEFNAEYTDNGTLYHGTNPIAGLCVLRGGFIMSNEKQGTALYGPGTYSTKAYSEAASYAGNNGLVIQMQLEKGENRIIDWDKLDETLKEKLTIEAKEKGYDHVFELLRDRDRYAIDIIVNSGYSVIQNQAAIDLNKSLTFMMKSLEGRFKSLIEAVEKVDRSNNLAELNPVVTEYLRLSGYYELFQIIGEEIGDSRQLSDNFHRTSILLQKYVDKMIIPLNLGDFKKIVDFFNNKFFPLYHDQLKSSGFNILGENTNDFLRPNIEKQSTSHPEHALSCAIYIGDIDLAIKVFKECKLSFGRAIEYYDEQKGYHYAKKIFEVIQELLQKKITLNDLDSYKAIVDKFQDSGIDLINQIDLLSGALASKNERFIDFLKDKVKLTNDHLSAAIQTQYTGFIKEILQREPALITEAHVMQAIKSNNVEILEILLEHGGKLDKDKPYLVEALSAEFNDEMVEFLLHKVDVAIPIAKQEARLIKPKSCLDALVLLNRTDLAQKIMDIARAYPPRSSKELEKLTEMNLLASLFGDEKEEESTSSASVLDSLVNCNHGQTLAKAVEFNKLDFVQLLLDNGANETKKALEVVRVKRRSSPETIVTLIKKGKDVDLTYLEKGLKLSELAIAILSDNLAKVQEIVISDPEQLNQMNNELGLTTLQLTCLNPKLKEICDNALIKEKSRVELLMRHSDSHKQSQTEIQETIPSRNKPK